MSQTTMETLGTTNHEKETQSSLCLRTYRPAPFYFHGNQSDGSSRQCRV